MDERLGVLDLEVAMVNSKIRSMEEEIRLGRAFIGLSSQSGKSGVVSPDSINSPPSYIPSTTDGDLGWENGSLIQSDDIFD